MGFARITNIGGPPCPVVGLKSAKIIHDPVMGVREIIYKLRKDLENNKFVQ